MSSGLDFETKILVKHDAARLLRRELAHPHYTPDTLGLCGVTDPYQPIERKLELTRGVLQILVECHHPVGIVTKNHLVTRDIDLLRQLARDEAVAVYLSITTLDPSLTRVMEPRTSVPRDRLAALRALAEAGVPCGVLMAPVIPGLTDHELPNILQAAAEHGACCAGFVPLRLPHAVATLFVDFLEQHFPDRKEKVLRRIREMRGGALNDPRFGSRMRGEGIFAEQWRAMFHTYAARLGLSHHGPNLTAAHFVPPPPLKGQLLLFDQT